MFYEQLFHTKIFVQLLCALQFGSVIFWQKDFGTKAAHKMLVKLTPCWIHRHLSNIYCLKALTAWLVCFISTVNGHRKKEKEALKHWR
jgi:hypothetical protein